MKFLLNFKSNLTSLRFLMMSFTLKKSKNNDLLEYFLSHKSAVFCNFQCFPFCTQCLWFFCVFRIAINFPLLCKDFRFYHSTHQVYGGIACAIMSFKQYILVHFILVIHTMKGCKEYLISHPFIKCVQYFILTYTWWMDRPLSGATCQSKRS